MHALLVSCDLDERKIAKALTEIGLDERIGLFSPI
jgi:hypothetical protein